MFPFSEVTANKQLRRIVDPKVTGRAIGLFMRAFSLFLSVSAALPGACLAQFSGENLLQTLPPGYKVDFRDSQGDKTISMTMVEMVPHSETVMNWSEMVTTLIFRGFRIGTPEEFKSRTVKDWLAKCEDGGFEPVTKGDENGYPFSIWVLTCPLFQSSGKPEYVWFKAIQGNDSFYVVQKAFRFAPSEEQVVQWMKYFSSVFVCDTRLPDRPCPVLEKMD